MPKSSPRTISLISSEVFTHASSAHQGLVGNGARGRLLGRLGDGRGELAVSAAGGWRVAMLTRTLPRHWRYGQPGTRFIGTSLRWPTCPDAV
jgi:hypothetical protein